MKKSLFAGATAVLLLLFTGCNLSGDEPKMPFPENEQKVAIEDGNVIHIVYAGYTRRITCYYYDKNDVFGYVRVETTYYTVSEAQLAYQDMEKRIQEEELEGQIRGTALKDNTVIIEYTREHDEEKYGNLSAEELKAKIEEFINNPPSNTENL